ncbi:MAG: hypothetical protein QM608_20285 [Caulobacter sp.]
MEVKEDRSEQILLLHEGKDRARPSHTGAYDKTILCAACDNILARYETYAYERLQAWRLQPSPVGKFATVDDLDGDTMVRFAAGLAWKYAVTSEARGRIDVGPYADVLRDVALGGASIPESLDVAMVRIFERGDVYYYREPLLDRQEGVNFVRFCVGGFLFFLKIDKRRSMRMFPADSWLRGRTSGRIPTVLPEQVEEGRSCAQLVGRPEVRKFFQTARERKSARRGA